jgi:uncharacterized membrane protein YgdD (TMEM256/DUF423 family)
MSTSAMLLLRLAALNGFLAVALGAFGAHSLKDRLTPDMLAVWKTGTEYHLSHALALFLTALLFNYLTAQGQTRAAKQVQLAGYLFAVGILLFSGSLYALAGSGTRILGVITPLGGVCFLVGWLLLLGTAIKNEGSVGKG